VRAASVTHLVAGADLLGGAAHVHALCDVGALLLDGHDHVARLVVEALGGVVVADLGDGLAHDLLVVDGRLGGDLAEDHDHASLGRGLAGHLAASGGKGQSESSKR